MKTSELTIKTQPVKVMMHSAARLAAVTALVATLAACGAGGDGSGIPEALQRAATASPAPSEVASIQAPAAKINAPVFTATLENLAKQRVPEPVHLKVADVGIDMDVTDVGLLSDGTLEIPERAAIAGWYRAMAAPGEDDGVALFAAHVDDPYGLGPFASLRKISEGAEVDVALDDGETVKYRVSAVEETSKENVDFERILDGSLGHHLVMVTCGGEFDWDTRHYEDNVIVWAERVND